MITDFFNIQQHLKNETMKLNNIKIQKILQNYNFLNISEESDIINSDEINNNIKSSKFITVNCIQDLVQKEKTYFIGSFEKSIFIIEKHQLPKLGSFLTINQNIEICFLNNAEEVFYENITIRFKELENNIRKDELNILETNIKIAFNDEGDKLPNRELNNYRKIKHPFIPKFYGITSKNKFLVIEYIFGETLSNFDLTKINENDKINIIFELMAVIYYLHQNQFVYRDLHLNNVMIDNNKTIILIDFDRMININDIPKTQNFGSYYAAPEITNNKDSNTKLSYQSDIYSLGKIIYYIIGLFEKVKTFIK